jgi:hypothetical protein
MLVAALTAASRDGPDNNNVAVAVVVVVLAVTLGTQDHWIQSAAFQSASISRSAVQNTFH